MLRRNREVSCWLKLIVVVVLLCGWNTGKNENSGTLVTAFNLFQRTPPPPPAATTNMLPSIATASAVGKVAVAGATGKTGQYVVEELMRRGVPNVVALVRDGERATNIFENATDISNGNITSSLQIVECDLTNELKMKPILQTVDALVWCATGFSNEDSARTNRLLQLQQLFNLVVFPEKTLDIVAIPALVNSLLNNKATKKSKVVVEEGGDKVEKNCPRFVMCSTAAVTRPIWDEEKQAKYSGSFDIPIVRLNPFGILNIKRSSEAQLRRSGISYCVVRPCGLRDADSWPVNARPVISQGDVAVGRIHRRDVAKLLVDVLSIPEATSKTFEVFTVAGKDYPPPPSLRTVVSRLSEDGSDVGSLKADSDAALQATYHLVQQMLPGEKQDSAALAMGQTYEELDRGQEGRLGPRGREDAMAAAPKPSGS